MRHNSCSLSSRYPTRSGRGVASSSPTPSRCAHRLELDLGSHMPGQVRHTTLAWREDFPRIMDDLPRRRLPNVDFPSLWSGVESEVKALLFPQSWSPQDIFTWRLLIFVSLFIAVLAELTAVATRTARNLAKIREARQQATLRRGKPLESDDAQGLEPAPDIPRTQQAMRQLQTDRTLYRKEIREERTRGLAWLALVTAVAIWCTGILSKDNALQP